MSRGDLLFFVSRTGVLIEILTINFLIFRLYSYTLRVSIYSLKNENEFKFVMINAFYNEKFPALDIDEDFFLRKQLVKDAEAFFEYYTHPEEVARYILVSNPRNLAEATAEIHCCRDLFKHRCGIYWTLARKKGDYMIGAIGIYINNQHYQAEICYDLSHQYWNRGIMTKAIKIVIYFSFRHIPINRIEAVTLKENVASVATLKKIGFVHESTIRKYRYFNGQSYNIEVFAITPKMITQKPFSHFEHIAI